MIARTFRAGFVASALLAFGCAPSTVMDEKHFERDCVTAGQCRPVKYGDVCSGCQCLNGAANEQGALKYDLERKDIECKTAPPQCTCDLPRVACVDGLCVLQ